MVPTLTSLLANSPPTNMNNSCQFKILAHMLNRNRSAHDITVLYNVTDKESFNYVKSLGEIDERATDGANKPLPPRTSAVRHPRRRCSQKKRRSSRILTSETCDTSETSESGETIDGSRRLSRG